MTSRDFRKQIDGYVLTTARIFYHMPDYPALLQTYVWQDYDIAPTFPVLHGFLAFWETKLDGPIHSVRVACKNIISPVEMRSVTGFFPLH